MFIKMVSRIEGTSGLYRHQFETMQRKISLLIASSKENTSQQRWPNSLRVYRGQLSSRSRPSFDLYKNLSPQHDQQLFVWQQFFD